MRPLTLATRLLPLLLMLVVLTAGGWAAGQAPDYGRLLGAAAGGTPGRGTEELRHSRPVGPAAPALGVSAEDGERLTAAEADPMLAAAQKAVSLFRERLVELLQRAPRAFDAIDTTLAAASPSGRGSYFLGVAIFAGLLLVVGNAATAFFAHFVARPAFIRMQAAPTDGYGGKLPLLAFRVLLTVVGLALTVAVAAAVGLFFYEEHSATQATVIVVFAVYAAIRLSDTIWRMMLAPLLPRLRLPRIDDAAARRLYRWLTYTTAFAIVASAFSYWMLELELPREVHVLVTVLLTLLIVVVVLLAVRAEHETVTSMLLAGRPRVEASWLQRAGAALWAPLLSLYLVCAWGDMAFRLIMGVEAGASRLLAPYVTLIAALSVYAFGVYVIERLFERQRQMQALNAAARGTTAPMGAVQAAPVAATGGAPAEDGDEDGDEEADDDGTASERVALATAPRPRRHGMRSFEDLAQRAAALVALAVAAYTLAVFWAGAGIFSDDRLVETALDLLQVCFVGYVVFHACRIWLDRKIEDEGGDIEVIPGEEGGATGASRLATLLPLVRNFILLVIMTAVVVIVAMELGANVAPLFAGAGIVGLAIGFGSQTLVRDILSGAFFLLDDAFRKGEYIDVGHVKGTVEKISLRSFQLRHHLGMLHTIPFGEIQHLTNFSRDWVMMKLPLRLTYDTDVERVRKLIKKLGQRLFDDPEIGAKFMQPLKSQGVIQMDDSAMIVRVKFMTRPGDQWVIRKRVFAEIRALFEHEGIHFAHREVTVRIPDLPKDRELDAATQQAVGAASRTALDVIEKEELGRTGTDGPIDDR